MKKRHRSLSRQPADRKLNIGKEREKEKDRALIRAALGHTTNLKKKKNPKELV
jgi:hypothetical protein